MTPTAPARKQESSPGYRNTLIIIAQNNHQPCQIFLPPPGMTLNGTADRKEDFIGKQ